MIERTARPTAVLPVSVLPVLVLVPLSPGLEPNGFVFCISVSLFSVKTGSASSPIAFLRASHGLPDSCGALPHPASGRMPSRASRCRGPNSQRLRRRRCAPPIRFRRPSALLIVSLPHSFSPSGMERGMHIAASAAPVLAIPPPIPTLHRYGAGNAYRCLGCAGPGDPATDPHSGIRDSGSLSGPPLAALRPAPLALAAPQRQCPARFRVLCLVCIPLSIPPILLSALSALPACQTD